MRSLQQRALNICLLWMFWKTTIAQGKPTFLIFKEITGCEHVRILNYSFAFCVDKNKVTHLEWTVATHKRQDVFIILCSQNFNHWFGIKHIHVYSDAWKLYTKVFS